MASVVIGFATICETYPDCWGIRIDVSGPQDAAVLATAHRVCADVVESVRGAIYVENASGRDACYRVRIETEGGDKTTAVRISDTLNEGVVAKWRAQ